MDRPGRFRFCNLGQLTMTTWLCPACTLFYEEPLKLNTAPFSKGEGCQGAGHLNGKKHRNAMKSLGESLQLPATWNAFFDYVHEFPKPDLNRITPMEALMEYTAQCGGDAEKTASHFINHVPSPVAPAPGRPKIKAVVRNIASKAYLCPNKHARERRLDKATMLLGRPHYQQ